MELPDLLALQQDPGAGIGVLKGIGEIPADLGRALAVDARWRRLLVQPTTGQLLDLGRKQYRPSRALRDYLMASVAECRGAYCTRTPWEIDHATDWTLGGRTDRDNLSPYCTHTHHLKTFLGFTATAAPDGTRTWTTPGGNSYEKPPDDVRTTRYGTTGA